MNLSTDFFVFGVSFKFGFCHCFVENQKILVLFLGRDLSLFWFVNKLVYFGECDNTHNVR